MIQLEINNRKIGFIEVEVNANAFKVYNYEGNTFIDWFIGEQVGVNGILLPPGDYTIIGKGDEITDKEILEQVKAHNLTHSTTLVVEIK